MSDVSVFQIGDKQINVKDKTARTNASTAVTTAQEAATQAANALQKINEVAELSRIEVSYTDSTETITITTTDHAVAAAKIAELMEVPNA